MADPRRRGSTAAAEGEDKVANTPPEDALAAASRKALSCCILRRRTFIICWRCSRSVIQLGAPGPGRVDAGFTIRPEGKSCRSLLGCLDCAPISSYPSPSRRMRVPRSQQRSQLQVNRINGCCACYCAIIVPRPKSKSDQIIYFRLIESRATIETMVLVAQIPN